MKVILLLGRAFPESPFDKLQATLQEKERRIVELETLWARAEESAGRWHAEWMKSITTQFIVVGSPSEVVRGFRHERIRRLVSWIRTQDRNRPKVPGVDRAGLVPGRLPGLRCSRFRRRSVLESQ